MRRNYRQQIACTFLLISTMIDCVSCYAGRRRRNVMVCCPSVCLSRRHAYRDSSGAACDAASVHFGSTTRSTSSRTFNNFWCVSLATSCRPRSFESNAKEVRVDFALHNERLLNLACECETTSVVVGTTGLCKSSLRMLGGPLKILKKILG